jgi:hypothetical protein
MSPTTKKNNSGVLMRRASCSGWFAGRPPLVSFVSGVLMLASFVGDLGLFSLLACADLISLVVAIVVYRRSSRLGYRSQNTGPSVSHSDSDRGD